ncbi:MAG TPA: 50S ribosomal protein L11 methyltransferase [Longimicrobiales bacterium]|nr:50S ribosomal protein L11 methyltransferase [Longimicrobiales bacterium]
MPARWIVLTVRVPSEELAHELSEGLFALGGTAVEEDADLLTTYIPEPDDPEGFLRVATERLRGLAGSAPELLWRWQADEDWSRRWKEGLDPRPVGRRLTITQPWNPVAEDGGRIVVVIDPATAFGTGEHATTRGALEYVERAIRGGERVLDVGTGSGILAIAAARLGAGSVLAVESDPDALDNCRENLERNAVAGRVALECAVVDPAWLAADPEGFDVIAANVLSGVLTPLLPDLAGALRPGGRVILGGILDHEAPALKEAAAAAGLRVAHERLEGEWWTGLLEGA